MSYLKRKLRKIVSELTPRKPFQSSASYWEDRYKSGGRSGSGSYDELAKFKANVINEFMREKHIKTVIEHGCGDGNQLTYGDYPTYMGFDVSSEAISICKENFSHDDTKTFKLNSEYSGETAELALSLDVIFHLVEDDVFESYMTRLFDSAEKYVIIYSSNLEVGETMDHVRHRKFSDYIEKNNPGWKLLATVPNEYPYSEKTRSGSTSDFFIYGKL
jgi:hypothetical protein